LVGHIYFEKRGICKSIALSRKICGSKEKVRREDLYELSFCYYVTKDLPKAIEGFKQLGGAQDSLAQNSMYLLADAYLKTNDKPMQERLSSSAHPITVMQYRKKCLPLTMANFLMNWVIWTRH
jgi:TPR repeat protein